MIYIIKFWREFIIMLLIIACGVLTLKLQAANYTAKETKLIHERLVAESDSKASKLIAETQAQRKIDAELYANEINHLNNLYNDAITKSNRVQSEIRVYNTRLTEVSRKAVENYAQTASTIYGECRSEYLKMGHYASRLDAELDKVTSPQ